MQPISLFLKSVEAELNEEERSKEKKKEAEAGKETDAAEDDSSHGRQKMTFGIAKDHLTTFLLDKILFLA